MCFSVSSVILMLRILFDWLFVCCSSPDAVNISVDDEGKVLPLFKLENRALYIAVTFMSPRLRNTVSV